MEEKKSNLALSADLTRCEEVLKVADLVGPFISILKTHVDILDDFSQSFVAKLTALAKKHSFLIFEDRKFADIGNTVMHQYKGGIYHIADWADITNAHAVPGVGIIEGLKEVGLPKGNALLLLAEMSSKGTLAKGEYTKAVVEMAKQHKDFCIGFICLKKLSDDPTFIHMTPGVQLKAGSDALGQQYQTIEDAINAGTDVIIVGRGILTAKDPEAEAQLYQKRGWEAYVKRQRT